MIAIRPADECRYDVVTLGEVMLRFDPGEGRVRSTRAFSVSEGGGEYNVGRALRRCFGQRVSHITGVGDNDVGLLLEDLMRQGGDALDHVVRKATDAYGRRHRTPLNFTERGFGLRSSRGVYDRAHSATAALAPDDVDWDRLFGDLGVRWLHTGGIFAGLSASTLAVTQAALDAARRHGTVVSYDINFRPSLWAASGGAAGASELTAQLLDGVDVLFGVDAARFSVVVDELAASHGRLAAIASPVRGVHSASRNDWRGVAWSATTGVVEGLGFDRIEVLDRVGSGDGFAAGVIFGLLTGETLPDALRLGIAHGALVMTTAGDTSSVDLEEVRRLADGGDASAVR